MGRGSFGSPSFLMYLYKSFCYATLQDVANSVQSQGILSSGDTISSVVVQPTWLDVTITSPSLIDRVYTLTPPLCDQAGFDNSFFGVSPADAVSISWLAMAVMITAYSLKILKRAS